MKRRKILVTMLLIISIGIYIGISTININQNNYIKKSRGIINKNNDLVVNWDGSGKVTKVKIKYNQTCDSKTLLEKINQYLLFLNGGNVVEVTYTLGDPKVLPAIAKLYFNPFTKQFIGYEPPPNPNTY
ncbi:MAG TPA: hypothetical protein VIK72_17575 [Clostridiaceae bacterium]